MSKNPKPIETEYRGIIFRSKLEAQWAVFLDECGADWEYEPEGFEWNDGIQYLPDFLVHDVFQNLKGKKRDLWIEVKGVMDEKSINKIKHLTWGDLSIIKNNAKEYIDWWLEMCTNRNETFVFEFPDNPIPLENNVLVVGKMPLEDDFKDIWSWINKTYPNQGLTKPFYSARNNMECFGPRVFPVNAGGKGIRLWDEVTDDKYIPEATRKAFHTARNYRFDHKN